MSTTQAAELPETPRNSLKNSRQDYEAWIQEHAAIPYGRCAALTQEMAAAFPELTRVRGHYYCFGWGEREHWWLTTPDGTVIDPTKAQFPSQGLGHYEPLDESQPEPTGICPQCGDQVFDGGTCCSEDCHMAYVAYCTNPGGW